MVFYIFYLLNFIVTRQTPTRSAEEEIEERRRNFELNPDDIKVVVDNLDPEIETTADPMATQVFKKFENFGLLPSEVVSIWMEPRYMYSLGEKLPSTVTDAFEKVMTSKIFSSSEGVKNNSGLFLGLMKKMADAILPIVNKKIDAAIARSNEESEQQSPTPQEQPAQPPAQPVAAGLKSSSKSNGSKKEESSKLLSKLKYYE